MFGGEFVPIHNVIGVDESVEDREALFAVQKPIVVVRVDSGHFLVTKMLEPYIFIMDVFHSGAFTKEKNQHVTPSLRRSQMYFIINQILIAVEMGFRYSKPCLKKPRPLF